MNMECRNAKMNTGPNLMSIETFDISPEGIAASLSTYTVECPKVVIDNEAVERTIAVIRRQHAFFHGVERTARDGDRLTIDCKGFVDGSPMCGLHCSGLTFILGDGQMLQELEQAVFGMAVGQTGTFSAAFSEDYCGLDVSGKTVNFFFEIVKIEELLLPNIDAMFLQSFGIGGSDIAKLKSEVRANMEREIEKRIETSIREQALQLLCASNPLELPELMVRKEYLHLRKAASADLQREMYLKRPSPGRVKLEEVARRRVALDILITELARAEKLQPCPSEVRMLLEREAQNSENPDRMVQWIMRQPDQMSELEKVVLEDKAVKWVLAHVRTVDATLSFDELMREEIH
jgi:trigger factor